MRRDQEEGGGAGPSREPSTDQEQGSGDSSHRELNNPLLQLFLNSCFSDTVFVTLLRAAVETAISGVRKLLRTGGVPTSLTLLL